MTISSTTSEISYAGNGVTLAFDIPFVFDTSADLLIYEQVVSTGIVTQRTTGIVVSGGDGSTGTLTYSVAPPTGTNITILDNPERTQTHDYVSNDPFPAESHEGALDKLTRLVKRLYQTSLKSLRVADGDTYTDLTLPVKASRASKFLAFDANGNPIASAAVSDGDALLRAELIAGSSSLVNSTGIKYDITAAEIAGLVTPSDYSIPFFPFYQIGRTGAVNGGDLTGPLNRAISALPSTGGTIWITDASSGYTMTAGVVVNKPIKILCGATTITGPTSGWMFDLTVNGATFQGQGTTATKLKLSAPASAVSLPTATCTLSAGSVNAQTLTFAGANLYVTPIMEVTSSATGDDAAFIPTVAAGVVSGIARVAAGSGYVGAPTIAFKGGGAGAIKSNEILGGDIGGFSVDMSSVANATGVYQYGGWYNHFHDIEIIRTSIAATACGFVIDSHTLGIPGPTGSYGGAYVNNYTNINTDRVYIVGHDTSTATTLQFDTVDCTSMLIHGTVAVIMNNPVVQSSGGVFFDLVNVDGLSLNGGDIEGSSTWFRSRGSNNNINMNGTLAYSATGSVIAGLYGPGWNINPAKANSISPPLRTGSGGSAGQRYRGTGWNTEANVGIHYSGDTFNVGMNLTMISATQGNLTDITNGGTVISMDVSGQIIVYSATAGANPRTLAVRGTFNKVYTVATLPAAATSSYSRLFVSDSSVTAFNSVVAGGGANGVPVYSDGANWRIG